MKTWPRDKKGMLTEDIHNIIKWISISITLILAIPCLLLGGIGEPTSAAMGFAIVFGLLYVAIWIVTIPFLVIFKLLDLFFN